jgi:outer membrane protein W
MTSRLSVFLFASCLFLHSPLLSAQENTCPAPCPAPCEEPCPIEPSCSVNVPILEAKAGYFIFASSTMRRIYDGAYDVQLSATYPVWEWLGVYASAEYLYASGRSLHGDEDTSIWELPVSLGLKSVVEVNDKVTCYFTLGPRYVYVHQHNDSPYVDETISRNWFGGFANTGFNFAFGDHWIFDVFAEYSYVQIDYDAKKPNTYGESIQVGGVLFGGSLGYTF